MSWIRKPTELEIELAILGFECVKGLGAVSLSLSSRLLLSRPLLPCLSGYLGHLHGILPKHSLGLLPKARRLLPSLVPVTLPSPGLTRRGFWNGFGI